MYRLAAKDDLGAVDNAELTALTSIPGVNLTLKIDQTDGTWWVGR